MKILPNRNIELTVQLLPEAYAQLAAAADRDKCSIADVVNIAVLTYGVISMAADKTGRNIGQAADKPEADRG